MKIEYPIIIKDTLPKKILFSLNDNFYYNGWRLDNISNPDYMRSSKPDKKSWSSGDKNNLVIFEAASFIKLKIQKHLKKDLRFIRAHINGQTFGQCGNFHIDYHQDEVWTFIYFCSLSWDTNFGGEFVCYDPNKQEYKYVPYIPNTGCLIPSNWDHYGSSPNDLTDNLRISIGFSFCSNNSFESIKNYKSVLPFI